MATTQTKNGTTTIDAAFDQFKEQGQQMLTTARRVGNLARSFLE